MSRMLRIRRKPPSPKTMQVIGHLDYVCLTPGSDSRSFLSSPIPVSAEVSDGITSVCIDENHGVISKGSSYDVGGPLHISRVQAPVSVSASTTILSKAGVLPPGAATHNGFDGSDWRIRYTGAFALTTNQWGDGWATIAPSGRNEYHPIVDPDNLPDLGARAYNRLRPKVAKVSAFQTLAEIGETPEMLKTSAKGLADFWRGLTYRKDLMPRYEAERQARNWRRLPGKASDHFLNHAFGWVPFVKDLRDIVDLMLNSSKYVAQMKRSNGEWVQREFHEDVVEERTVIYNDTGRYMNQCTPAMNSSAWVQPGTGYYRITRERVTRVWYAGSFKQYLPEFDDSLMSGHPNLQELAQAVRLYGLDVNPVNIYKVMPWTFALDWFVNVGENLQVLQDMATDAVVSRYLYLMREAREHFVYECGWTCYDGQVVNLTWVAGRDVKRREVAGSPFGFTLLGSGLSTKQLAILGALGISRVS